MTDVQALELCFVAGQCGTVNIHRSQLRSIDANNVVDEFVISESLLCG